MADQPTAPQPADDGQGARLDPVRVLQKLQVLNPELVQLAMLQVHVEDQDKVIAGLRAELVQATAATVPARPAAR